MLSPHEFATLMLIRHAPDQLDTSRAEIDTLLERQLIMLEHAGGGYRRVHLTSRGHALLDAFGSGGAGRARRDTYRRHRDARHPDPHQRLATTAIDANPSVQPQT
ncbi:hypothetical protein [Burkholderia sp. IMCC1007]|uniref:hypothetical protein n=1 Tax=Burkholderia sp. IMCC1007 TaxID=3004104 RepID=UPI0022B4DCB7|nr:hypothetical protein [Burkholderia sp. IMCC1007]